MAEQKRQTNRRDSRAVTVWLNDEQWDRLDWIAARLNLDRSKVIKFYIDGYAPGGVVAHYIESLATPRNGGEGAT